MRVATSEDWFFLVVLKRLREQQRGLVLPRGLEAIRRERRRRTQSRRELHKDKDEEQEQEQQQQQQQQRYDSSS